MALLAIVGEKGAGKSSCAAYLAKKHGHKVISESDALKRDTQDGLWIVDGVSSIETLDKLIANGATVWLVRRPRAGDSWKGRTITIKVDNYGTFRDLEISAEQKLWGCC